MNAAKRPPKVALALAGGGPLGAIYELGTLVALAETLEGIDFNDIDVYVGVSAGGFIAAGLANGLSPAYMHRMFIDSDSADMAFNPEALFKPAFHEYAQRAATVPQLLFKSWSEYLRNPLRRNFLTSFRHLSQAIPTGVLNGAGIRASLAHLFSLPGMTDDFRDLKRRLFLIATELDSGTSVAFGSKGHDQVPISTAIQASSALPGLFPPVEIDGRSFVDGALRKTLHASVALKEGCKLVICVNPVVPFDARRASQKGDAKRRRLVDGGLPVVLAQTFRSLIHSRMQVGMARYDIEYADADVILFEPNRDDVDMFFTNMFSYADRKRLSEHAYRKTRDELRRRYAELSPKLARHGISINRAVLAQPRRSTVRLMAGLNRQRAGPMGLATVRLSDTLDDLANALRRLEYQRRPAN